LPYAFLPKHGICDAFVCPFAVIGGNPGEHRDNAAFLLVGREMMRSNEELARKLLSLEKKNDMTVSPLIVSGR
jgi:hypothetical protein